MKIQRLLACVLIGLTSAHGVHVHAQAKPENTKLSTSRILGVWLDDSVKCKLSIELRANKYESILRECRDLKPDEDIRTLLVKMNGDVYREDIRPRKSWHYKIAASGDLEVRDSEGVVRKLNSVIPKTEQQLEARNKSEGVHIGMTAQQVIQSSWGKPIRINRTATSIGTREQWVYRGGYIYVQDGLVVAIQN